MLQIKSCIKHNKKISKKRSLDNSIHSKLLKLLESISVRTNNLEEINVLLIEKFNIVVICQFITAEVQDQSPKKIVKLKNLQWLVKKVLR